MKVGMIERHNLGDNGDGGSVVLVDLVLRGHGDGHGVGVRLRDGHLDGHLLDVHLGGVLHGHLGSDGLSGADGSQHLLLGDEHIHRGGISGRDGGLDINDGGSRDVDGEGMSEGSSVGGVGDGRSGVGYGGGVGNGGSSNGSRVGNRGGGNRGRVGERSSNEGVSISQRIGQSLGFSLSFLVSRALGDLLLLGGNSERSAEVRVGERDGLDGGSGDGDGGEGGGQRGLQDLGRVSDDYRFLNVVNLGLDDSRCRSGDHWSVERVRGEQVLGSTESDGRKQRENNLFQTCYINSLAQLLNLI